jgi:vacuolar-type H+-ATPase subunit E/Vma4
MRFYTLSESVKLIKNEIIRRAQEETKKTISEAEVQAKTILSSAEAKAHEVVMASVKPEIEVMRRKILGSQMLEGRKMLLKLKYEITLKVLNSVEDKLRKIASGKEDSIDYDALLSNLLEEAILKLGEDEVIIRANKRDLSHLSKNLNKIQRKLSKTMHDKIKLELTDKPLSCIGGVIVANKDGKKTFINTLEGRLSKARGIIQGKILQELLS